MADRIVVLKDGVVEQVGVPLELYDCRCNAFVAGFIGLPSMNFIAGRLDLDGAPRVVTDAGLHLPLLHAPRERHGSRVLYGTRPEHFSLDAGGGLPADVIVVELTGSETQIAARLGAQDIIVAFRERIGARPGDRLALLPQARQAHLFDAASGSTDALTVDLPQGLACYFFRDVLLATSTAWLVAATKLDSATATAFLAEFCADSIMFCPPAIALFNAATVASVPAGAFFSKLASTPANAPCTSLALASNAFVTSAPVPERSVYNCRP